MAPKRSTCFAALAAGEAAVARPLRSSFTQQRPRRVMLFELHVMPNVLHMPLAGSVGLQSRDETAAGTTVAMLGAGKLLFGAGGDLGLPYPASAAALTGGNLPMIPPTPSARASHRIRRWGGRPSDCCRSTGA